MNRERSSMARWGLFLALVMGMTLVTPACMTATDGESETTVGQVSLALTAVSGTTTYRLADATFDIEGPTATVLSSADDPSITVLTAELATGNYLSTLQGGWQLERFDGTAFVPVEATLVSANPADFTITDGQVTDLVYQFDTDGTIVTIGTGSLNISIDVNETTSGCTAFGEGCATDEWCAPGSVLESEENVCVPTGTLLVGEPCDGTINCVENALCAQISADGPQCVELCPISELGNACASGGVCSDSGFADAGVCL